MMPGRLTSELHTLGDGAFSLSARGSKDHAEYQPDASAYGNPQAHIAEGGAEYNAQCSAHDKANADVVLFHGLNIAKAGVAERVGFEPTVRSPVHLISSQALSATQPPLRREVYRQRMGTSNETATKVLNG